VNSRRQILKIGAVSGAGLLMPFKGLVKRVFAQIPGGTLPPGDIPKHVTPLVIPPAMPRTGVVQKAGQTAIDYYTIAVRQFRQGILPSGMPMTTVWSYGSTTDRTSFNYPAFTIEAKAGRPVRVKWMNDLKDPDTGNFLPHLLPVDPTLHWANPPGGTMGRDMRPAFASTPGPYTGPVPIVTHLHGAAGVGDESDGYAEAWYLPAANGIPAGFAKVGTWHEYFQAKAKARFGVAWPTGAAVFQYPNDQRAATLWYHDHTLGMTRVNVYAGPAGFYILRGGPGDAVLDGRDGTTAVLPGPAPALGDPPGLKYYEIPIAIQDRSFNADGSLFYPDTREFFDGTAGPYVPDTDISPIWNPEFFGNTIVVNGKTWPFLEVEQRRYRFRFLNGCNSRFLILKFDHPGVDVWQIGTEGGFLPAPLRINDLDVGGLGGALLMGLAERADVIVDFSHLPVGTSFRLLNLGPDEPFGGFPTPAAHPATTGQVMEFRVVAATSADTSTPPRFLRLPAITHLVGGTARPLALLERPSAFFDGPAEALLGTFDPATGTPTEKMWSEPITENPAVGAVEVWELYNLTEDAHPMHLHEIHFQVVNRQRLSRGTNRPIGPRRSPEAWETGFKDTVIAYPGEVTRLRVRFEQPGLFVWHCHIVEHEDNEMMRPLAIGPIPTPLP
jgi:FtsP/CotA-like multicopper oxidase with cupredoxin domain